MTTKIVITFIKYYFYQGQQPQTRSRMIEGGQILYDDTLHDKGTSLIQDGSGIKRKWSEEGEDEDQKRLKRSCGKY